MAQTKEVTEPRDNRRWLPLLLVMRNGLAEHETPLSAMHAQCYAGGAGKAALMIRMIRMP